MKRALLLIDVQNDFLPGGALAVPKGDEIVPVVNQLLEQTWDCIIATKDWHPQDHKSFAVNHPGRSVGEFVDLEGVQQILWPAHCVQETEGADFANGLHVDKIDEVFYKGTDPNVDSYSAFFDNAKKRATGLDDYLKGKGVDELYVVGLATDYCVLYSVLDALALGYKVTVILDGCRGIDLKEGDVDHAIERMKDAGCSAIITQSTVP